MDTISKQKLAYYAGFIDGEGTITIKRAYRNKKLYYTVNCSCGQVNKKPNSDVVREMKNLFGGYVYEWSQKLGSNRIDTIQWCVTSKLAKDFLNLITPYLVIKRKQAEVAKKFNKTIYKKFRHTSDKTREKRAILFDEMRKYNVKGRLRLQRLNEETPKGEAIV
jgi:hypothetical protein